MTTEQRLERDLPTILGDLAIAPYPDYVDSVLSTTAQRRQRPAWTFPERWLPMDLATQRAPTSRVPWRTIGALALIALVIAATLAFYVGSQRQRLPAPFGVATNGAVVYDQDGRIYAHDPETGTTTALTTTDEGWEAPWPSLDGTRMVLARELGPGKVEFGVLPMSGGEVTVVTPEPVDSLGHIDFSPDGRELLLDSIVHLVPSISIIDVETREMRTLPLGVPASRPSYRPLDGAEILFAADSPLGEDRLDVMVANADGSDVRTLFASTMEAATYDYPRYSPDGSRIAFGVWYPAEQVGRLHVMNADGTGDRVVADDAGVRGTGSPLWSPDGTTVAVERDAQGQSRLAFIDVDTGHVVMSDLDVSDGAAKEWSPDGTTLFVGPKDADDAYLPQVLVDRATGAVTPAPWGAAAYPSWQRTAD